MPIGTFLVKPNHDAAPAFKRLMETMKRRPCNLKCKQRGDDFLVTFEYDVQFDHVWDRFWEDADWIKQHRSSQ